MKDIQKLPNLTGKVAIVTGGVNGIGKITAIHLSQAGTAISVADYDLKDELSEGK